MAIVRDGQTIARARSASVRHHVENIAPMLRELLTEAGLPTTGADLRAVGLDAVLVGTGPAPFTGLRAGLVSARVFAHAAGVPVYGVASLDVLARGALDVLPPGTPVIALSDARRRELYWGLYRALGPDDVALEGRLEVGEPTLLTRDLRQTEALVVCEEALPPHSVEVLQGAPVGPTAVLDPAIMVRIVLARLARGDISHLSAEPQYLRRPDIHGQNPQRL